MNICMLNPFFSPYQGGTEKYLLQTCARLARKHSISVLTAQLEGTKRHERMHGFTVYRTPSIVLRALPYPLPPPYAISPLLARDLQRIAKQECVDVFHIHNRFCYHAGTLLQIKLLRRRLALTLHNARVHGVSLATDSLSSLYDCTLGALCMQAADGIACNSRYTLEASIPAALQNKASIVYNGIDVDAYKVGNDGDRIRKALALESAEPLVLSVGRLVEQKGVDYLLRAFALFSREHSTARLLIAGKGPQEAHLRRLRANLGIADKVVFAGYISDSLLPFYYAASDIFVLPSLWEPFGMVLLEAMASGKAVIASRTGGVPEVVGDAGLLVPPRDVSALARALSTLASDATLRKKLGALGCARARRYFSWDKIAKDLDNFYRTIA